MSARKVEYNSSINVTVSPISRFSLPRVLDTRTTSWCHFRNFLKFMFSPKNLCIWCSSTCTWICNFISGGGWQVEWRHQRAEGDVWGERRPVGSHVTHELRGQIYNNECCDRWVSRLSGGFRIPYLRVWFISNMGDLVHRVSSKRNTNLSFGFYTLVWHTWGRFQSSITRNKSLRLLAPPSGIERNYGSFPASR